MSLPSEFLGECDFFLDEDTRAKRIGILALDKNLTPALTQALFRARESNLNHGMEHFSKKFAEDPTARSAAITQNTKQLREVKWSSMNNPRLFLAKNFIENYLHYFAKPGQPAPIQFFTAPFVGDHLTSIAKFFAQLEGIPFCHGKTFIPGRSVLFVDFFTTGLGAKFEQQLRDRARLSRCYRLDSKTHDLLQLTDLLLGIAVNRRSVRDLRAPCKKMLAKHYLTLGKKFLGDRAEAAIQDIF